jgi:predicted MFS family arabinose efflux permease
MTSQPPVSAAWGAVIAMALGIFGIVGAEFLPASLLSPIAQSLEVTEGMAGQSIAITAAVAFVSSLLIAPLTSRIDRRHVLILLTLFLVLSNLMVAAASNYEILLLARVLLGIALGGFWSLSPATMMRLVPPSDVPKALGLLFGGVSAATVFASPLGSFFGEVLGWRAVFVAAAGLGIIALAIQMATLPLMPTLAAARFGTLLSLLRRPGVGVGLLAIMLVFWGHFSFFSYLRPFLEGVTQLDPLGITMTLLVFGVGTFVGNSLASLCIQASLRGTIVSMPLLMAALAASLFILGGTSIGDAVLVGVWGMSFGVVPVAWSTWITKVMPDQAESGGGLLIAAIQLAITLGAGVGGLIFDAYGSRMVFLASVAILAAGFISALLIKTPAVRQVG